MNLPNKSTRAILVAVICATLGMVWVSFWVDEAVAFTTINKNLNPKILVLNCTQECWGLI
jgi:hypothetical protein